MNLMKKAIQYKGRCIKMEEFNGELNDELEEKFKNIQDILNRVKKSFKIKDNHNDLPLISKREYYDFIIDLETDKIKL